MNFYQILEIDAGARPEDIKKAFRTQAKRYHPDVSTEANANEYFRLVYIAYDILKDPSKRALYDRMQRMKSDTSESRLRDWQHRASQQAHAYANMDFDEFEDTFLSRLQFHGSQTLAFVMFFVILCIGLMSIMAGLHMLFEENFNGSYVISYMLLAAGGAFSWFSFKALWEIFSSWNQGGD